MGCVLQSTGSTCGPAALATIFNYYGISKSEEEIARAAFSSSSGTENWTIVGRIVMTFAIIIIAIGYFVSKKIMDIKI